jgi:hypothetical protein
MVSFMKTKCMKTVETRTQKRADRTKRRLKRAALDKGVGAATVAGFVFGFFSFAMIGMDSDEIQTSIKPLRRVFVRSLSAFLGR